MNSAIRALQSGRRVYIDESGIFRLRNGLFGAELFVDDLGDAGCSGEVLIAELQPDVRRRLHGRRDAFDARAIRHAADGRMVNGLVVSAAAGHKSAGHNRPLGDGIDLPVGSAERRHQQQAALEIAGIADGRGCNVDFRAGLGKWRKRRGYHHAGGVGHDDRGRVRQRNAHPLQHVGEALRAEDSCGLSPVLFSPTTIP